MGKTYNIRRFRHSNASEVSALIIKTLRTTNSKDYSAERIEIPASITACQFYINIGYTYKDGIDVMDEEQLFPLVKFR